MRRIFAGMVLVAMGATPAVAQDSNSFLDCSTISDSLQRLICYDEAVGKMRRDTLLNDRTIGRAPVSGAAPALVGPGSPKTTGTLGAGGSLAAPAVAMPIQDPDAYEAANSGTFGVAEAKVFGNTMMVLLDNGAVWRQIDGKDFKVPTGGVLTAKVVPAFENSYFLSMSKDGAERVRQMRVRRVR